MIRAGAAALLAMVLAAPVSAQNVDGYLALARQYAAGDGDKATTALATWSRLEIGSVGIVDQSASAHDLLALAMLHTELANNIIDARAEDARLHLNVAEARLIAATSRIGQRERLAPFVRRWYRFAAGVYTSSHLFAPAAALIQRGINRFSDDPDLFVARGVVIEVSIRRTLVSDWRRDTVFGLPNHGAVERALQQAEVPFRHALSLDARHAGAHLHLGWIRAFRGDTAAQDDLEAAIADAPDDRLRYLAHLFLGGLVERQHHLDEARREYEQAKALGPEYQTPYVALSRIEQALGHDARAHELALIAVQVDKSDEDDPWWDHRIGFDRESLLWLRREVRRPQ